MAKANCIRIEENNAICPCKNTGCENHSICCECVAHHKKSESYPACLRYENTE